MTVRDATARRTPFEIGLPGREFAEDRLGAIAQEASARGSDLTDPGAFLLLGQVGRTVKDLGEGEEGGQTLHTLGAFLFHAFHFQRAGRPLFLVETRLARYLVEGKPVAEGWDGSPPEPAGYLQLPRHLFWTRPDPEGPAEALDGVFWTEAAEGSLSLLGVTGIVEGREGFTVLPLPPVPYADAGACVRRPAREGGVDFETTLPGGELDHLYSIETAGELLKLTARALGYMATVPEGLGPEEEARAGEAGPGEAGSGAAASGEASPGPGGHAPSRLPFRRLRLVGGPGPNDQPRTSDPGS